MDNSGHFYLMIFALVCPTVSYLGTTTASFCPLGDEISFMFRKGMHVVVVCQSVVYSIFFFFFFPPCFVYLFFHYCVVLFFFILSSSFHAFFFFVKLNICIYFCLIICFIYFFLKLFLYLHYFLSVRTLFCYSLNISKISHHFSNDFEYSIYVCFIYTHKTNIYT